MLGETPVDDYPEGDNEMYFSTDRIDVSGIAPSTLANSGLLMAALVAEGEEVASINMVGVCGCTVVTLVARGTHHLRRRPRLPGRQREEERRRRAQQGNPEPNLKGPSRCDVVPTHLITLLDIRNCYHITSYHHERSR